MCDAQYLCKPRAEQSWGFRELGDRNVLEKVILRSSYTISGDRLITEGKYSVWFGTPVGDGAGVVDFESNGQLSGGDATFAYSGYWKQEGERFRATISAKRTAPGPPGVFGVDELDIVVTGYSDGGESTSCSGFAKQAPGLKLDVTLVRLRDD
jgi:hypothetical protein